MKRKAILLIFIIILLLGGCAVSGVSKDTDSSQAQDQDTDIHTNLEAYSSELFAMDTYMTLTVYAQRQELADEALEAAEQEIQRLDELLSTGKDSSEVGQLNLKGEGILSDDSAYLLNRSLEVNRLSGGTFNPMVYPLMKAWGFTSGEYRIPEAEEIEGLLNLTDLSDLIYDEQSRQLYFGKEGMMVDFGGIAKGYTSAQVMKVLEEYGVHDAVVSLGGNVQVMGSKADGSLWRVAIRDPEDTSAFLGILSLTDKAVITSGAYERYFEQDGLIYHHILDPFTGYPAESGMISVTIISDDAAFADGLSTALFVAGLDKASQIWAENNDRFDAVFVDSGKNVYVTEGISKDFQSDYPFTVIRLSDYPETEMKEEQDPVDLQSSSETQEPDDADRNGEESCLNINKEAVNIPAENNSGLSREEIPSGSISAYGYQDGQYLGTAEKTETGEELTMQVTVSDGQISAFHVLGYDCGEIETDVESKASYDVDMMMEAIGRALEQAIVSDK